MKSTRPLIILIIAASLLSAGVALYRFFVVRDYLVFANVPCDITLHSCFVGDGENTPRYYEKISKKANTIPTCNGWRDECPELRCAEGDADCTATFCEPQSDDECVGLVLVTQ